MLELSERRLSSLEKDIGCIPPRCGPTATPEGPSPTALAPWLFIKGFALHQLRRCPEALAPLQRAADAKNGDYKEALNVVGTCHYESGNYDGAIATFRSIIAKQPDFWQAYFNAGLASVKKGDPATARLYLEQLRPRNVVQASYLENEYIKPLETRLEKEKEALASRQRYERERAEKERAEKEAEAAKSKADAEAKAVVEAKAASDAKVEADAKARADAQSAAKAPQSLEERLRELKQLFVKGLISKEVYESSQRDLLKSR